jgi:hypothetical protein
LDQYQEVARGEVLFADLDEFDTGIEGSGDDGQEISGGREREAVSDVAAHSGGLVVTFAGAGAAEGLTAADDFPLEIDSFAADSAEGAGLFVAGEVFGAELDADPLGGEKLVVGQFSIGHHLLLVLVFDFGMELASTVLRGLEGDDADGSIGFQVAECGRHFAEIAEFQGPFSEATSGNDTDSVGGTAVDFNECYQAFAVLAGGIVESQEGETVEGHTETEDLAGADVPVGFFGERDVVLERQHPFSILEDRGV